LILGVAYTAFSEWLNIVVRQSWAYSERMPLIPLFGFRIGLSPLLQWIIVPATAFGLVRWITFKHSNERPTMNRVRHIAIAAIGITTLSAPTWAQTGDSARGERMYRACVACHSLEPNR